MSHKIDPVWRMKNSYRCHPNLYLGHLLALFLFSLQQLSATSISTISCLSVRCGEFVSQREIVVSFICVLTELWQTTLWLTIFQCPPRDHIHAFQGTSHPLTIGACITESDAAGVWVPGCNGHYLLRYDLRFNHFELPSLPLPLYYTTHVDHLRYWPSKPRALQVAFLFWGHAGEAHEQEAYARME